jgi:hypothetical protein
LRFCLPLLYIFCRTCADFSSTRALQSPSSDPVIAAALKFKSKTSKPAAAAPVSKLAKTAAVHASDAPSQPSATATKVAPVGSTGKGTSKKPHRADAGRVVPVASDRIKSKDVIVEAFSDADDDIGEVDPAFISNW